MGNDVFYAERMEGERLLKAAEDLHLKENPNAAVWYLRAIAHLLLALVKKP